MKIIGWLVCMVTRKHLRRVRMAEVGALDIDSIVKAKDGKLLVCPRCGDVKK